MFAFAKFGPTDYVIHFQRGRVKREGRGLFDLQAANERTSAETKAYALEAMLKPLAGIEWEKMVALSGGGADSRVAIAHAFRRLADNAQRIDTLNITSDLLKSLLDEDGDS